MLFDGVSYILLGIVAGLLSGLFGIGGGILVVPGLIFVFLHEGLPLANIIHVAAGTSLATMVITTLSSTISHHRRGTILWPVYRQFLPGIIIGVVCGAFVADHTHPFWLRTIFGVFLALVSLRLFMIAFITHNRVSKRKKQNLPGRLGVVSSGGVIGFLSGLFGIGTGTMTAPYLMYFGVKVRNASGTSAICSLTVGIVGTISVLVTGWENTHHLSTLTGYIHWPAFFAIAAFSLVFAPIGASLACRLPGLLLRRIFSIFLVLIAIYVLLGR